MNHHPSDDSANVPSSGQAVVAGVRDGDSLHLGTATSDGSPVELAVATASEHQESYHLNPLLQKALGCLDIKLADELTRFRAKQQDELGKQHPHPEQVSEHSPQVSPHQSVIWEQQAPDFEASQILTAEIVQPPPANDNLAPKGGFIIIDGLTTSASSSRNAIATTNYAPIALHRSTAPAMAENLDLNFSSGGEMAQFHNEYSSSSQELLRQIQSGNSAANSATPAPLPATAPRRKNLTPLKIGSMAVVCALAGGAVYTYLNPSILAPLTAAKVATPTTTALGQSIQSPNLAANEFTELNLSTLNTIKLPTVTATNISKVPTTIGAVPTTGATAPVAIPFNGLRGTNQMPTATISSQPRLADSLVRSLLPANFHSFAKPSGYRATPPRVGR